MLAHISFSDQSVAHRSLYNTDDEHSVTMRPCEPVPETGMCREKRWCRFKYEFLGGACVCLKGPLYACMDDVDDDFMEPTASHAPPGPPPCTKPSHACEQADCNIYKSHNIDIGNMYE